MISKNGKYWLNCLDDVVRDKWLSNYDPNWGSSELNLEDYLNTEMSFGFFIDRAFGWCDTREGENYWGMISLIEDDILIRNHRNNQLNKLPL